MSKGLEALEEIKEIRTKTYYVLELDLDDKLTKDLSIIEKELKALQILKEKGIQLSLRYADKLTQDEYNLLKEVLL